MTASRFVLVDFRYTSDPLGHIRLYEAGSIYDMPPALAHAAAKRDLVAAQRPIDWEPPSILRPPEVLTEAELAAAEAELKALQRHAFEVVDPESRQSIAANSGKNRLVSTGPIFCCHINQAVRVRTLSGPNHFSP